MLRRRAPRRPRLKAARRPATLECFIIGAAVGAAIAYGSGYYYPPYVYWGPGAVYPIYRPWPATYGAGVVHNPWNGGYAAGRVASRSIRSGGIFGVVQPVDWKVRAAQRARRGVYGGRTVAQAYNPWTGGYGATSQAHNAYGQWGSSVATRNGNWVQTGHVTTANGVLPLATEHRQGSMERLTPARMAAVIHGANNSVYAGNDGNVYRHDSSGGWSQYDNGSWNTVDTTAAKQQAQQNIQANHPNAQQNAQNFQANHPNAQQNVQTARQNAGSQNLGASRSGLQANPNTMQGLDRSAAARVSADSSSRVGSRTFIVAEVGSDDESLSLHASKS